MDDAKLQRMTVKITKSFNAKDVTVKVIDKFTLKCMTRNRHIKLGKTYNVHNIKKHGKRCVNLATGNESIATLFLTMTAVAEQTKSKAENMIQFCRTMDINDISLSHLIDKLQKVAEKPAYFNASLAKSMRDLCLEVGKSTMHPLYMRFTELCEAGKIVLSTDVESEADSDEESEESERQDIL